MTASATCALDPKDNTKTVQEVRGSANDPLPPVNDARGSHGTMKKNVPDQTESTIAREVSLC